MLNDIAMGQCKKDVTPLHVFLVLTSMVLVQERRNPIASAMELHFSCTNTTDIYFL